MKIIKNKIFPFFNYKAINLFGFVFTKSVLSQQDTNHEAIHSAQMKELLYVFFYLFYALEWLYKVIKLICTKNYDKFSNVFHLAYRKVSFEQECYSNEKNLSYLSTRRHFSMWRD